MTTLQLLLFSVDFKSYCKNDHKGRKRDPDPALEKPEPETNQFESNADSDPRSMKGGGGPAERLPGVEVLYGDPVRVEVDGEGGDVSHISVVDQRAEIHGATVQEIQDLNRLP